MVYQQVIKPIFFKMDPELVHDRTTTLGRVIGSNPLTRGMLAAALRYRDPILVQKVHGITFENPIGLAAGFDKNCQLMRILPAVGFGFEEVGSITAKPYGGNPKPRLVRLPKDQSIIVYYGLKNEGADVLRKKLCDASGRPRKFAIPIGVSIAKTNIEFKSLKAKIDDWVTGVQRLQDCGDYLTINVSCPNTFDPLNFNEPCLLDPLLKRMAPVVKSRKPIFLKLSADISTSQLDEIVKVCDKYTRTGLKGKAAASPAATGLKARARTERSAAAQDAAHASAGTRAKRVAASGRVPLVTGFIFTNLVKDRTSVKLKSRKSEYAPFKGGLSGRVVAPKALALTKYAYENFGERYTIISCGGIFTAQDAYERIRNGATLLQLVTGLIYGGPAVIGQINKGLAAQLKKDGFSNVSEAVGVDCKRKWK